MDEFDNFDWEKNDPIIIGHNTRHCPKCGQHHGTWRFLGSDCGIDIYYSLWQCNCCGVYLTSGGSEQ